MPEPGLLVFSGMDCLRSGVKVMLFISGNKNCYCPYRDCLGIDTSDGRISWYQLLGVSQAASSENMQHRYERRRALVLKNRKSTSHPVWDNLLDELDRAIAVLTNSERKREYDEDLLRRNRQSSMVRLPEKEADEWKAMMHAEKIRKAHQARRETTSSRHSPRVTYEPLRTVGEGPCGTRVYEAWEFRLNRRVAVRCLLRPARTKDRQQSFVEEAQFLASISHPNLVEVHTVNPRSCYMVMEYLEKTVIAHQAEQRHRQCHQDFVLRFLTHGLNILKRLHEAGVVHGAIGRRSFHLSEVGDIKLVDAPGCTMSGLFRAPRPDQTCIAPELLSPDSFGAPGLSADLYMLGFAAFELLAGDLIGKWIPKLAAKGESEQQTWMQWHASPLERLPSVESLIPGVSPALASVIETLCEKQVLDRFRSADEAIENLKSVNPDRSDGVPRPTKATFTQSSPAVNTRQVGGEAPLIHEARKISQRQPDLLETLQSPSLFWQQMRTNSRFRLTVTGTGILLLTVFAIAVSGNSPATASHTTTLTAKSNERSSSWSPPLDVPADRVQPSLSNESAGHSAPQELIQAIPTRASTTADDLDIAAVPISLNALRTSEAQPQATSDGESMAIESISPFPTIMAQKSEYSSLIKTLQELRTARTLYDKRRLYLRAKEMAPNDPRVPFLFTAASGFKPEFRSELRRAVELSEPHYSQPFRQLIECHLAEISQNGASAADQAIALLSDFASRISKLDASGDRLYDWEWIGRVIGYLEMEAAQDSHIAGMLAASVPRLLSLPSSDGVAGIQRGHRFAISVGRSVVPAAVLPLQPQIGYALCMKSFPDEEMSPIGTTSSAVAKHTK